MRAVSKIRSGIGTGRTGNMNEKSRESISEISMPTSSIRA